MLHELIDRAFQEHCALVTQARTELPALLAAVALQLTERLRQGRKILVFGNGGSASDAQHFAAELVGRFEVARRGLPAIALTTDTSILTAVGNDFGFERVFARQLESLARPGDVAIGISTSGRSPNVVLGMEAAKQNGCYCVALTGADPQALARHVDLCLCVPSQRSARIQELHGLCLHALAAALDCADWRT